MTASIGVLRSPSIRPARWLAPLAITAGLAAIVAARWWAARSGADALVLGAVFGLALTALAVAGSGLDASGPGRPGLRRRALRLAAIDTLRPAHVPRALIVGIAFGLALVAITAAGPALAGVQLVPGLGRPAAPFLPWALITILVASAEEAILRGVLFDGLRRAGGTIPAVLVTTAAFALMHVPLYGWHVVPLDLAVGLGLAGLRLSTRSIPAPAAAHSVADLATWWL
jgi:membrane protease YdiL (CAAX protease family)